MSGASSKGRLRGRASGALRCVDSTRARPPDPFYQQVISSMVRICFIEYVSYDHNLIVTICHQNIWLSSNFPIDDWWMVWNMNFIFTFSREFHHPNWLFRIFRRGRVQPPTRSLYHRYSIAIIMIFHRLSIDYHHYYP